jgi:hypothetical protein
MKNEYGIVIGDVYLVQGLQKLSITTISHRQIPKQSYLSNPSGYAVTYSYCHNGSIKNSNETCMELFVDDRLIMRRIV